MSAPMLTVFGILAGAIVLFAWGRPRVDIVAILVVLALMLSRVLTPHEALAGFGDPVVGLIAAIFIVGEALVDTGVVHRLGEAVMKLGRGDETRLIVLIMTLAGGIGAFMSSSAIVAMIVESTLRGRGLAPLDFFSWTPFGLAVLSAAIALVLAARGLLSKQLTAKDAAATSRSAYDLVSFYGLTDRWHQLCVPAESPLIERSVAQAKQLYEDLNAVLVGFERLKHGKRHFLPALPESVFETDDTIFVVADKNQVQQLVGA